MYNRPEEMSLADGGTVLHFARGGGAEIKKDTLMPNLSSLGDLPKDIAGKPPGSVGPALDDKFDMDPNQYGYQPSGPSYEKYKGDVFGNNLIDEFAKGKNFANPADAVTAYNKFNEDYFNSTPRLEGDDLASRQENAAYFSNENSSNLISEKYLLP